MKPTTKKTKAAITTESKPYKVEQLTNGKLEYRKIQAWQARDYDGELSNWQKGTLMAIAG